jgi:signal transduction histidine kinase
MDALLAVSWHVALERIDQLRTRMLAVGASIAMPVILVKSFREAGSLWDTVWTIGCIVALWWVAAKKATPHRSIIIVPTCLVVGLAPVVPLINGLDRVETALLPLAPIVIAVMFLDVRDLVMSVAVVGWASYTAVIIAAGWSVADVAATSGSLGIVLGVLAMAAVGAEKRRQIELKLENEHNQALRLSESRRSQAERLAIVGRLASGVAHEINNPLAYVKANVNALKRSASKEDELTPEELAELIADTTQGIDRICQIVSDLKGFAREDSGAVEPVDLHDAVKGAVRLATVRLPKEAKVLVELPPDLPFVHASPRKLAQVLLNLLVNAGDAMDEMRVPKPTVTISGRQLGDQVTLSVTDNGPGIPPATMSRMFEPFFTTKPPGKGTGLGLALSREYVENFGGTLSVQNVEPRGAQFSITMKVSARGELTPIPMTRRAS